MRTRAGWLTPLLVVLLVAVPIFEVWLLIQVGSQIGVLPTVAILVAEAILGGWLMKREGARAWAALNKSIGTGKMPSGELADAALVLVGGLLLMLPGFATDIIGFICLLPFTRPLARNVLAFLIARSVRRMAPVGLYPAGRRPGEGEVIEGETVDVPDAEHNNPRVIRGEIDDTPR